MLCPPPGIVEYMRRQAGPGSILLERAEDVRRFTRTREVTVVAYFNEHTGEEERGRRREGGRGRRRERGGGGREEEGGRRREGGGGREEEGGRRREGGGEREEERGRRREREEEGERGGKVGGGRKGVEGGRGRWCVYAFVLNVHKDAYYMYTTCICILF